MEDSRRVPDRALCGVDFEALVAQGAAVPLEYWDLSWFEGREAGQRLSWGYAQPLAQHLERPRSALHCRYYQPPVPSQFHGGMGRSLGTSSGEAHRWFSMAVAQVNQAMS